MVRRGFSYRKLFAALRTTNFPLFLGVDRHFYFSKVRIERYAFLYNGGFDGRLRYGAHDGRYNGRYDGSRLSLLSFFE